MEIFQQFKEEAPERNIELKIEGLETKRPTNPLQALKTVVAKP